MTLTADVAATLQPGFRGTTVPDWLVRAAEGGLVSVCLYGENVAGPEQLAALCASLHERMPGVLLAVDEEGGDVTRLHYPGGSPAVGNAVLGRLDDPGTTRAVAAGIGAELAALGIGLDLAPDADVNSTPDNPVIGVRSFGDDPRARRPPHGRVGRGPAVDRGRRVREALPGPRRHRRRLAPRAAPRRRAARRAPRARAGAVPRGGSGRSRRRS